jgi:hypothetical protein
MEPRTLVTGASAGIGLELARTFARHGHDLVLVARRADRLAELAGELQALGRRVDTVAIDLAEPDAATRLADDVAGRDIDVDVLVNNAGIGDHGAFRHLPRERIRQMLAVNVGALTELVHAFLPPMLARRRGRILNVASTAAFQPVPAMAAYAATKAYVLSLSEALAEELRGSGVTVTALCPGLTRTDMVADLPLPPPAFLVQDAAEVAAAGYDACLAGEAVRVPGLHNALGAVASRLPPRWLVRTVSGIAGRFAIGQQRPR